MNELVKRRKEIDDEFEEIIEGETDLLNTKSSMTITAVGVLLEKLDTHFTDMAEIANKQKYYDENLSSTVQSTIAELKTAFSQIQPPIINVSPQLKFDIQPLQNIAGKISEQNVTLINLIGKFNNNQNEVLLKLITSLVDKQISFLEMELKQIDITQNLVGIENAIRDKPKEWKANVTGYNSQNRIDEITIKVVSPIYKNNK